MATIQIYNRGKREFMNIKNAAGKTITLKREAFIEMDEVAGLRLLNAYPKDLTSQPGPSPTSDDIKRKEQSLQDRNKVLHDRAHDLDARERAIEGKEAELAAREAVMVARETSFDEKEKAARGRGGRRDRGNVGEPEPTEE